VIRDIRARGLEGLAVEVADFEATHGKVTFVARAVEERPTAAARQLGHR